MSKMNKKSRNGKRPNLKGNYFEFEIASSSTVAPFIFDGFEFTKVESYGYDK